MLGVLGSVPRALHQGLIWLGSLGLDVCNVRGKLLNLKVSYSRNGTRAGAAFVRLGLSFGDLMPAAGTWPFKDTKVPSDVQQQCS